MDITRPLGIFRMATLKAETASPITGPSMNDLMMEMSKYGKVVVGQYGDAGLWHCSMEVRVMVAGATFKLATDFKQPTPMDAVKECKKLLHAALEELGSSRK